MAKLTKLIQLKAHRCKYMETQKCTSTHHFYLIDWNLIFKKKFINLSHRSINVSSGTNPQTPQSTIQRDNNEIDEVFNYALNKLLDGWINHKQIWQFRSRANKMNNSKLNTNWRREKKTRLPDNGLEVGDVRAGFLCDWIGFSPDFKRGQ